MNFKRLLAGTLSVCFSVVSVAHGFPYKNEKPVMASAAADSKATLSHAITLEDVKAIQAFCLTADYVGPGEVIDVNNDGRVDVFDLTLAKRELINTGVPSLTDFSANVCDIYINSEEDVVFTLNVIEITPLDNNAISIYDNSDDFVAFMHDDGVNGDEIADDGIYTAVVSLTSDEIKTVDYYAATNDVKSNSYEICFYRDLEEDEFKNFWILYSYISELSYDEAIEYIKNSKEIKTFEIDENNKLITYQSIYNIYGCWEELDESSKDAKGSGTYAVPDKNGIDYLAVKKAISSSVISTAHNDKKNVIVLRPFRNSEFQYDDFKLTGNLIADALNSEVTVIDDANVTLEQMKNLSSYGVVLIDSHGTLKNKKTPYMLIGEDLNETKFLWDVGYYLQHTEYSADYISGRIYCTSFKRGQQTFNRMAVGGKFFEKYYSDNSLKDSFWFLGTCYSMYDNSIADALTNKGAEAVVGFTNPVSVGYCNSTLYETVLNSMVLSAENVNRSIIEAKRIYGQNDPNNSSTTIRMRGKTNYRVVNSITSKPPVNFDGGDGSEDNPYQISTPEQLDAVRNYMDKHFILTADVDMSQWGNWEPIGVVLPNYSTADPNRISNGIKIEQEYFTGVFDGNGHTINNLSIFNNDTYYEIGCYGLFSGTNGATIKNVHLNSLDLLIDKANTDYVKIWQDESTTFSVCVGGIVGQSTSNCTITNCTVSGKISVVHCSDAYVGGIAGLGSPTRCSNLASITVNADRDSRYVQDSTVHCGGIAGHTCTINSTVELCENYGKIDASAGGYLYLGGITGEYGRIYNCINYSDITGNILNYTGYSSFAGNCNVGGIVGATSSDYTQYCVNYGNITSNSAYRASSYAGGIVGFCGYYGSGRIYDCVNIGSKIRSTTKDKDDKTVNASAGRVLGGGSKVSSSYSNANTTVNGSTISDGTSSNGDGDDLSKEQLLLQSSYPDFDFENIWVIDSEIGGAVLKQKQDK